jgi:hypothetical protein
MVAGTFGAAHERVGLNAGLIGRRPVGPQLDPSLCAADDGEAPLTDHLRTRPSTSSHPDPWRRQNGARLFKTVIAQNAVPSDEHGPCSNDLHLTLWADRAPRATK